MPFPQRDEEEETLLARFESEADKAEVTKLIAEMKC